jgi:hypothetical protein
MDNASNNTKCIEEMNRLVLIGNKSYMGGGSYLQGHCTAHVVNLIANVAIQSLELSTLKLRQCLLQIKSSSKQKSIFEGIICDSYPDLLSVARPSLDCRTRWNSMLDMFVTSIRYGPVFATWYERGGNCPEIREAEWAKIKLYCDILSPLKDSTVLLSASNTPTIHHLFSEMYDLLLHIESCIGQGNAMAEGFEEDDMVMGVSIQDACSEMHEKWKKYFLDVDIVNAAAHVLDPRYKFRFMKEVLRGEDGEDLIDSSSL